MFGEFPPSFMETLLKIMRTWDVRLGFTTTLGFFYKIFDFNRFVESFVTRRVDRITVHGFSRSQLFKFSSFSAAVCC